jgi:colicin import membrane protein
MQMKTASVISAGLHAAVLVWAVVSFSGKTLEATPVDSLPVDMISEKDFTQLTKGSKDVPKSAATKPLVEKIADTQKVVEDTKPKVSDKPEIKATAEKPPEPPPTPEPKPVEKKESKPPAPEKPPEQMAQAKADPIADKIKKEEKKETKEAKAEAKPLPPKKPPLKKEPQFDPRKIAALLDQRDPQRNAATGAELNSNPSLGSVKGEAAQLSQSEFDALLARLRQCWNPPIGATNSDNLFVVFRVLFKRDGSVMQTPVLVQAPPSQFGPALAESAKRALLQCQPYTMLKPEHYEEWRDMEIKFDPREMLGG